MQINPYRRWLLILLLLSTCLLVTYAKGGRGGGSRGGSRGSSGRGSSRSRPTYRPAPAPRPSPRPTYNKPSPKPAPKPSPRPQPAPSPKPSAPEAAVVAKQPASNPNFKESQVQGSADRQPASNPNYKPDGSAPAGPPPPYSPAGHPAPNAPGGAPPPYQPGQRYPQQPGAAPQPYPGQQPPPYSGGPPGRPPAYPGQSPPYPVQPGQGGQPYPQQPGANRPYPVQPGQGGQPYPQQPGYPGGGYPQQPGYPGGYPQQPGMNRPYPVQPGFNYPGGGNRPYPQQPLGGNVWQPQSGRPAPSYMNYGGIPTGANMNTMPQKKKGFLGSLMSSGSNNHGKINKYHGSSYAGMAGGGLGRGGSFLGRHGKTMAMAAILPIVAIGAVGVAASMFRPRFGHMSMFSPMPYYHNHHGRGMYPEYAHLYDVNDNDYIGKCQKPLKSEHTEVRCKTSFDDIKCDAKCEDGYEFPHNITLISNKCWHYTGVWRPKKNYPACKPICDEGCLNGGDCIRPGVCQCPEEFRGDRCQFPKKNYVGCDARQLTKGEKNVGWVCHHAKNETVCNIRCKPPAEFESPAAEEYRCSQEGEWTPNSLPHCVAKEKND